MGTTLFKVVCLEDKKDHLNPDGSVRTFTDGKEATAFAQRLTMLKGHKWQPRKLVTDDKWKEREAKRFYDGTYYPVPWETQHWWHGSGPDLEHFAHVSIERDAQIAFTRDANQGSADLQTRMKPGRYLERYFGNDIDGDTIRKWVAEFSVTYEPIPLKFATKADEIREVYRNGPSSCMTHATSNYVSHHLKMHPVEVYAAGDLAVAYIEGTGRIPCDNCEELCDECDGKERRISARSVVWPERKIYTRIYGDGDRMEMLLKKKGFKNGSLTGAKLARVLIPQKISKDFCRGAAYVCPYIDSNVKVRDDGTNLIIDDAGECDARGTSGICIDNRVKCSACGTFDQQRDFVHTLDKRGQTTNEMICSTCARDTTKYLRDGYSGYYGLREDMINVEGFDPYHRRYIEEIFGVCSKTFTLCAKATMVAMLDGSMVSAEWFKSSGKRCDVCGKGLARTATTGCSKFNCWDGEWMGRNKALYDQAVEFALTHQKRDGYASEKPKPEYLSHYISRLERGRTGVSF